MIRITAEITKQFFEELQNGDASFNEVEWDIHIPTMKIDLSETKPVYEIHIWHDKTEPPLGIFDDFEKFDDKDKALEAYHKLDCAYKVLMEYVGDDGDALLEYSRGDE